MSVSFRRDAKPPNVMSTARLVEFNCALVGAGVGGFIGLSIWYTQGLDWQLYLIAAVIVLASVSGVIRAVRIGAQEWQLQRSFEKVWHEADGGHSARFLTWEELEAAGCAAGERVIGLKHGRPLFAPTKIEQSHSLILSANGGGKTSCGALPTVISLAHQISLGRRLSVCVTDSKGGEIVQQVAPVLDELRIPYFILDDFELMPGHPRLVAMNPFGQLAWVAKNEPRSFRLTIDRIMHTLWPSPEVHGQNEYFYAEPRNRGAMAIEFLHGLKGASFQPGSVWALLNDPAAWLQLVKNAAKSGPDHLRGECQKVLQHIKDKHEHEPSHLGAALRAFSPFAAGGWLHNLVPAKGDKPIFEHRELMKKPCMLFIVGRSDFAATAKAYYGLHLQAAMQAQLTSAFFEVHYVAEEAANSPLKEMTEQMQTLRGLGARIHVVANSKTALEMAYGVRATRAIFNEANVKQYFSFTNYAEAKELAEAIGYEVIIKPGLTQNGGQGRMGRSWAVSRELLMSADRLMSLPYDQQIIHIARLGFVHCKKVHSSHIGPYANDLGRNTVENKDAVVNIKFDLGAS